MNKHVYYLLFVLFPLGASAQTLTDGLMMPKGDLCTGFMYSHDSWTDYWEGNLNRSNGNMGTVTTQSVTWIGTYGIIDKVNVLVTLPYVWTNATGGTWAPMKGVQDISVGAKYNFWSHRTEKTTLKFFGVFNYSMPVTDYVIDYLPMSIGMGSKKLQYRLSTYFRIEKGWFINGSGGYTWRSNVELDRVSHPDGDGIVNGTEAYLPNIFDVFVSTGYHKGPIQAELNYIEQYMPNGDDIARNVAPEVGNQMNYKKLGVTVMYYLPAPKGLALRAAGSITVDGRNVGQSNTLMAGALYTIHFSKNKKTLEP